MSKFIVSLDIKGHPDYIYMEKDQFLAFVKKYDLPIFIDSKGREISWYNGLLINCL
jgi:hypothetical protein